MNTWMAQLAVPFIARGVLRCRLSLPDTLPVQPHLHHVWGTPLVKKGIVVVLTALRFLPLDTHALDCRTYIFPLGGGRGGKIIDFYPQKGHNAYRNVNDSWCDKEILAMHRALRGRPWWHRID